MFIENGISDDKTIITSCSNIYLEHVKCRNVKLVVAPMFAFVMQNAHKKLAPTGDKYRNMPLILPH